MPYAVIIVSCIVFLLACEGQTEHERSSLSAKEADSLHFGQSPRFDSSDIACRILSSFPSSLDSIEKTGTAQLDWMKGSDSCVLQVVDSIVARINTSDSLKFTRYLAIITQFSDGYLSDYLCECLVGLFVKKHRAIIDYITTERDSHTAAVFRDRIVDCLRLEMTYNADSSFSSQISQIADEDLQELTEGEDSVLIRDFYNEIFYDKKY